MRDGVIKSERGGERDRGEEEGRRATRDEFSLPERNLLDRK